MCHLMKQEQLQITNFISCWWNNNYFLLFLRVLAFLSMHRYNCVVLFQKKETNNKNSAIISILWFSMVYIPVVTKWLGGRSIFTWQEKAILYICSGALHTNNKKRKLIQQILKIEHARLGNYKVSSETWPIASRGQSYQSLLQ